MISSTFVQMKRLSCSYFRRNMSYSIQVLSKELKVKNKLKDYVMKLQREELKQIN